MTTAKKWPIGTIGALLLALTVGRISYSLCLRRLFRNIWLPGMPDKIAPVYQSCTDRELVESVSLVITVKDTCGQADLFLTHLSNMFPSDMNVLYAYPNIRGCRHVPVDAIGQKLFSNFTSFIVGAADAPIAGFLKVQPHLKTKYAVLAHNDAYPIEKDFACEMFRALEANPHYPIAAPQIYETAGNGIIVPHGHHQNLHVRPSTSGEGLRIDYDLSLKLLTERVPADFKEGPQVDFLEDHAYFARSDRYHELLDPAGSFTLEYMDMILNMRARNTSAWYVPTARCIFNVDLSLLTWEDLPYLVYKRSEQIGHQVRTYLTKKWGVEFVNTGIWNYVRYNMLADLVLTKDAIPKDWKDQAAIFFSWFESVGFNRYNGKFLPEFIEEPTSLPVKVSRNSNIELPTDVLEHRVPPMSAEEILPKENQKKGLIEISFKEPHLPIAIRMSQCDVTKPDSWRSCGLAVQDGDTCTCWNYVAPFNLKTTFWLDNLMRLMKLPARAFMYGQMKYWPVHIEPETVSFYCGRNQEECEHTVQFSKSAQVLQWSWFGPETTPIFTPEGFVIGSCIFLLTCVPMLLSSRRMQYWFGLKQQQLRSLAAVSALVSGQSSSS